MRLWIKPLIVTVFSIALYFFFFFANRQLKGNSLFSFIYMCASECAFGPVRAVRVEFRRSYQVPWNWSYRSDTYVWVLRTKPGSSGKAAKAPDHSTTFPAHKQHFITRQKPKAVAVPAWHSSCPIGSVHHLHSAPCFPWCHPGAPGHPPHSPLLPPLHLPLLLPRYPWVQQSPPVCHMDNQADCAQQWGWH